VTAYFHHRGSCAAEDEFLVANLGDMQPFKDVPE